MLRTLALAVGFACFTASAAFADMTYTVKVDVKKGQAPASTNPLLAQIGQGLVQALAPGGASTMTITGNSAGVRVESDSPGLNLPKGGALLRLTDGSRIVLDTTERVYWKLPPLRTGQTRAASPKVTFMRTGKFANVAGVRAERVTFSATFELPQGARASQPDLPALTVDGELWVARNIDVPPAAKLMTDASLQALGLDGVVQDGFVMRQVLRGALFNGIEIESVVTRLNTKPVTADRLEVPKDFMEVKPRQAAPAAPARGGRAPR